MRDEIRLEETRRTLTVGENDPIQICTGHRVQRHEGKYGQPHGHNYQVHISVTGTLTDDGVVADLDTVEGTVKEWDHCFLLERGDPLIDAFEQSGDGDAVVVLEHPPTVEVMSRVLEEKLQRELPETVEEIAVAVHETGELGARPG